MLMEAKLSYQDHAPLQLNHVPLTAHTYVTQDEKTMLVFTKYSSLHITSLSHLLCKLYKFCKLY